MKPDLNECSLIVTNGLNGKVDTYRDFFKFSHIVQEQMISELILPMIYEYKSVHVSIGYKD